MTIGASIFLIAVGAILTFAINVSSNALNVHTIGVILMIAGAVGLLLSLFFWTTASNRRSVVDTGGAAGTVEEREVSTRRY